MSAPPQRSASDHVQWPGLEFSAAGHLFAMEMERTRTARQMRHYLPLDFRLS